MFFFRACLNKIRACPFSKATCTGSVHEQCFLGALQCQTTENIEKVIQTSACVPRCHLYVCVSVTALKHGVCSNATFFVYFRLVQCPPVRRIPEDLDRFLLSFCFTFPFPHIHKSTAKPKLLREFYYLFTFSVRHSQLMIVYFYQPV